MPRLRGSVSDLDSGVLARLRPTPLRARPQGIPDPRQPLRERVLRTALRGHRRRYPGGFVQAGDMARDAAGDAARLAPRPAVLHLHRPRRARGGELVEARSLPDPGGGMGGAVGAQRGSHAEGLRRLRAGAAAADLVRGAGLAPRAHGGTAVRVPGHRVRAPHGRLLDARASRLQGQQRHDLADQAPSRGAGSGQGGKRRAR